MAKLYDTSPEAEKAILVGVFLKGEDRDEALELLDELEQLANTAGAEVIEKIYQELPAFNPATLLGKGKLQEIKELAELEDVHLIIFDNELSPIQMRNLSNELQIKVLDRSGLILDIFSKNARTTEAQLEVQLAQMQYLLPRLSRMWAHISEQYGGIGTRGPGETQLESDRRVVRHHIQILKEKLQQIDKPNKEQRKQRKKMPRFALVGYTNSGKSTLMNTITDANVLVENKLFATLSTTVRQFTLPNNKPALLSDTIGFIRKLPHHLIASFRTTLAEANESDVLLQVIDITNQNFRVMINTVNETLEDIGIKDKPMIYVFNKIDKLDSLDLLHQLQSEYPQSVFISAERGLNVTTLLERMQNEYEKYNSTFSLLIPYSAGADMNKLYENAEILERNDDNEGTHLQIKVESRNKDKLMPLIRKYLKEEKLI